MWDLHIETWTEGPPFCTRYFQIYFHQWKYSYFILKVLPDYIPNAWATIEERSIPKDINTFSHISLPADTLRNNDVVITSKRRYYFDVITSQWRRSDVITTLLLRHVFRDPFSSNAYLVRFWHIVTYWMNSRLFSKLNVSCNFFNGKINWHTGWW